MHGEILQMWLTKLKIAIIEKDTDSLDKLLDDIPQLESEKEKEEAVYLLEEAKNLVNVLKDETANSMKLIKKNLEFLRSTDIPTSRSLDTMS